MTDDWLLGDRRSDRARERLVDIATTLIRQNGVDRFDVDEVARRAHCSRATVYRHVGGKRDMVDAVLVRSSVHITAVVAELIADLRGTDRAEAAIGLALAEMRRDKVVHQLLVSRRLAGAVPAALASSALTRAAVMLLGLVPDDTAAAQWAVRGFLSLAMWPMEPDHEARAVRSLVAGVELAADPQER